MFAQEKQGLDAQEKELEAELAQLQLRRQELQWG